MLNQVLRLLRVFHDMKAKDLAKRINISPAYLSEIENGKKEPSIEILNKYSEIFNMSVSSIFLLAEGAENKYKPRSIKESLAQYIIKFLNNVEEAGNASNTR